MCRKIEKWERIVKNYLGMNPLLKIYYLEYNFLIYVKFIINSAIVIIILRLLYDVHTYYLTITIIKIFLSLDH